MVAAIQRHAVKAGLPSGGLHAFRRDAAREISLMLDADATRELLNHDQQKNAMSKHYTTGAALMDLTGLRTGEALTDAQRARVAESTLPHTRAYGLAQRALASRSPTECQDGGPLVPMPKRKRSAAQSHDDVVADAMSADPRMATLKDEFETLARAHKCRRVGSRYERASLRRVKAELAKLPALCEGPARSRLARMQVVAEEMQAIKTSTQKKKSVRVYSTMGQASSPANPLSVADLRQANVDLAARDQQRAGRSSLDVSYRRQLADAVGESSKEGESSSSVAAPALVDSDLDIQTWPDEPTSDGPSFGNVDTALVINDDLATGTSTDVATACAARLQFVDLLLALRVGRGRYAALVEYTTAASVCPLCSASTSLGPHLHGGRAPAVFTTLPPKDASADALRSYLGARMDAVRRHLVDSQGELIHHVLLGGRLSSRAFVSPWVPALLAFESSALDAGVSADKIEHPLALRFLAPAPSLVARPSTPLNIDTQRRRSR